MKEDAVAGPPIFVEEALSIDPADARALDADAREWAVARSDRSAGARRVSRRRRTADARAWSVSALETYLTCPFRFFAQHVLRLEEEPDDEEVMDPMTAGPVRP